MRNLGSFYYMWSVMMLLVLAAYGLSWGQQDDGPVMMEVQQDFETQAQSIQEYWTPERMKNAKPMPLPKAVTGPEPEINAEFQLAPGEYPSFAPGWRPGSKRPQPGPDDYIEITPNDSLYQSLLGGNQLQTSQPF